MIWAENVNGLAICLLPEKPDFKMASPGISPNYQRAPGPGAGSLARENMNKETVDISEIISRISEAILIVGQDRTIRFANQAAEKLFGKERSELVGELFGFPIETEDDSELQIHRKENIRFAEMRLVELQWQGEDTSLVSLRDVTERKKLLEQHQAMEEKMWQSQKMEAIGNATAGIAENYEELLSNLLLCLKSMEFEDLSRSGRKSLECATGMAQKGTELTENLLSAATEDSFKPHPVEANLVIKSMELLIASTLGKYLSLKIFPLTMRRSIYVDPNGFKQALINLAANSREAMTPGGNFQIKIRETEIEKKNYAPVNGMPRGKYIVFTIIDDGCGMKSEDLKQAVEKHFTTKKGRTAAGLGLTQVADFMKKSDGFMDIKSKAGLGTTVRLYFPYHDNK